MVYWVNVSESCGAGLLGSTWTKGAVKWLLITGLKP